MFGYGSLWLEVLRCAMGGFPDGGACVRDGVRCREWEINVYHAESVNVIRGEQRRGEVSQMSWGILMR